MHRVTKRASRARLRAPSATDASDGPPSQGRRDRSARANWRFSSRRPRARSPSRTRRAKRVMPFSSVASPPRYAPADRSCQARVDRFGRRTSRDQGRRFAGPPHAPRELGEVQRLHAEPITAEQQRAPRVGRARRTRTARSTRETIVWPHRSSAHSKRLGVAVADELRAFELCSCAGSDGCRSRRYTQATSRR